MRNPDKYISIISKIANNRTVVSNEGFQTVSTYLFFEKGIYFDKLFYIENMMVFSLKKSDVIAIQVTWSTVQLKACVFSIVIQLIFNFCFVSFISLKLSVRNSSELYNALG